MGSTEPHLLAGSAMTDEMTGISSMEFGAPWCRLFIMGDECLLATKQMIPISRKNLKPEINTRFVYNLKKVQAQDSHLFKTCELNTLLYAYMSRDM